MDAETAAAVEVMVARTGHAAYRVFAADSHPDHRAWRALLSRLASGPWPSAPDPAPPAPAPPELDLLRALFCPHQRLAGCACGKPYECAPADRRPGRKLTAEECNACLARERRDGA